MNSFIDALNNITDTNNNPKSKLAELEQKLALLMINTEENFVLVDKNLKIVNFNNAFKKQYLLLFGKGVFKGDSILDYALPERIEMVKKIYARVFAGETVESEIKVPLPDKTFATYQNKFKPAYDEDEEIIGAFVSSKDITEKVSVQEQLIASEKRFRALIENAAEIIALIDSDFKVAYVSPSLEKVTGYLPGEIIGDYFFSIINEEEGDGKVIDKALKNHGVPIPSLKCFQHKNGQDLWLEGTVINLLEDINVNAIVANYRDITERVNAEEKNRQSEANLRAIFNSSSEGLMLLDTNGVIKAFNSKSAENHMLYSVKDDLKIGHHLIDYVDESRKENFKTFIARVLTGETIEYDIDYARKDGTKHWFHASLSPVYEQELITGICITRSDISERKIGEEKLKSSHEVLMRLTENVPAAIYKFEISNEGKMSFPFMSPSIVNIIPGVTVEQIMEDASAAFRYVHPEDINSLMMSIEESRQKRSDWDLEYRVLYEDNSIRWFKGSSRPENRTASGDDKVVWYGYIEDITERKHSELQLQKLLNISGDQNKRLQNFAYIVSHNIRSHSSNITGLVNFIRESGNEEDKLKFFKMLKTSTDKLQETIENLNEIVTIQNDSEISKKSINLKEEMCKTTDVINAMISETNATLINEIPDNLIVKVVPSYLESVMLNILTNALKYRSPLREPVIKVSAEKTGNFILLSVNDNGLGINLKKNGTKLFGMYKTFHNNKDARGFGLFISKNQIEAMNGKIEVESELGIGSTFKIYINHEED